MQPRIYTYKITFEEVPYYYYGSKKEKIFDEEYWGSPITNKWCWEFYTPNKQILELFDYSDEGYAKCRKIEDRLIKPVLNDFWCLNESCGGNYSLKVLRGVGNYITENKIGIHSMTYEERSNLGKINGLNHYKNQTGIFSMTKEMKKEIASKVGIENKKLKRGIFARTPEEWKEQNRKNGINCVLSGQMSKIHSLGGKATSSQKWICTETGFITNAGALTSYQRKRNIDTSKRKRMDIL
jgi:hypothetical protein